MDFFKHTPHIDFMRWRWFFVWVSAALVLASIVLFVVRGFNFGIDFTGGTLIEVAYPQSVQLGEVRQALDDAGFERAVTQYFGTSSDVLIRIPPRHGEGSAKLSNQVLDALQQTTKGAELRRVEFVGPQVGEDLREQGGLAVLYALIMILVYVAVRFEWRLSLGAVIALVHDVIITLGVFSLLQLEFNLNVLAAILTIIGYSLNDSIVVFDRIRETFRRVRKKSEEEIINISINQTLSRTVNTSLATLMVVLALYFVGGSVLSGFSVALIVGIIVGTYSSVYVASSYALMLGVSRTDLMPVKKEEEGLSARP
ncbi:MAG TPA: protein translocase subunit SecF [Gammaproteobacteria bacterium]|nr:protein translocase subunit SecF [Gammaproteobacteria bacterium]